MHGLRCAVMIVEVTGFHQCLYNGCNGSVGDLYICSNQVASPTLPTCLYTIATELSTGTYVDGSGARGTLEKVRHGIM